MIPFYINVINGGGKYGLPALGIVQYEETHAQ